MTRDKARLLFSDYLEDTLEPAARDELQAFLALEPDAAAELIALERTLSLLHRLPEREPTLDLWREFAPQVTAFRAERRLSLLARLRGQWSIFVASVSEGVILWTQALAHRAHHGLSHHLHRDPWQPFHADDRKE